MPSFFVCHQDGSSMPFTVCQISSFPTLLSILPILGLLHVYIYICNSIYNNVFILDDIFY